MYLLRAHSPRFKDASAGATRRARANISRRIDDHDAARGRGRNVDRVDASTGAADHAQSRRGLQQCFRHARFTPHQQCFGLPKVALKCFSVSNNDLDTRVWPQNGQPLFGNRVSDQDQRFLARQRLLQALLASDCQTHPEAILAAVVGARELFSSTRSARSAAARSS